MSRTGIIYREPDPKRRIIMITPNGITANCIAADKVEAQICEQKSDAIAEYLANQ